tara:strand:+ start:251 stop:604 length:354 start_codon:yes stop_codon:yes gene_type:complete
MNRENTIDYIEIPASDPALVRDFFEKLFCWTFEDYGPDYCSFNDGRMAGGFYRADSHAAVAAGSVLVVFYNDDLEAAVQRVTVAGGRISKEIFTFPGGRRFHFQDPCGNEYAIWSER